LPDVLFDPEDESDMSLYNGSLQTACHYNWEGYTLYRWFLQCVMLMDDRGGMIFDGMSELT
jgi:hypothetical protein